MNSGQVRFEFHHYSFLGENSQVAARAAECAAQQDLFWEFYDSLFEEWGVDAFGSANNRRIAAEIGVDTTTFNKCFDQKRVQKYVDADVELATSMGVGSTPFFFINGRPVKGLADLEVFEQMIDEELGRTGLLKTGAHEVEGKGCSDSETEPECA